MQTERNDRMERGWNLGASCAREVFLEETSIEIPGQFRARTGGRWCRAYAGGADDDAGAAFRAPDLAADSVRVAV